VNVAKSRIVLVAAALLLPLGLAACGTKGPLDPPPSAGFADTAPQGPGSSEANIPQPGIQFVGVQPTSPSQPVSPAAVENAPAARQRSVLDWLID